jgi:ADP-ribosyl-[dinitrogen reductase] hydrolase
MTDQNIRTSDTHPIRIDVVQPLGGWGYIGMSFCPGKVQDNARTGSWCRNLEKDVARIREWGASTVVSLIELPEFAELNVATLPCEVEKQGMSWMHLPIRDMHPPCGKFMSQWDKYGEELVTQLAAGKNIFIHCKGGLGRTGTIAACLLIESGMKHMTAIDSIRKARQNTIETVAQELFVLTYEARFL